MCTRRPVTDPYDSGPIRSHERLSRFVYDRGKCKIQKERVDVSGFLPPKEGDNTEEISVWRTEGLTDEKVWSYAQPRSHGPAVARGDFTPEDVARSKDANWQLRAEPSPPARHVRIIGWPPVSERMARRFLARKLSQVAQLVLHEEHFYS